jgi:hypothetical protein
MAISLFAVTTRLLTRTFLIKHVGADDGWYLSRSRVKYKAVMIT